MGTFPPLEVCRLDPVCIINYRGPAGFASSAARAVGVGECEVPADHMNAPFERGAYLFAQICIHLIDNRALLGNFLMPVLHKYLRWAEGSATSPVQKWQVEMDYALHEPGVSPLRYGAALTWVRAD